MEIKATKIPGCYIIQPHIATDKRGYFIKTFHQDIFNEKDLKTDWAEEYYSVSKKGVLRGLHFQLPPHEHAKLVYCTAGEVLDAVVDLRIGSPTYGNYLTFNLTAVNASIIYIPPGLAHGFYTLSKKATMMYKVNSIYMPDLDSGILWSSAGIPWPDSKPIISERDKSLPLMSEFKSPFVYSG